MQIFQITNCAVTQLELHLTLLGISNWVYPILNSHLIFNFKIRKVNFIDFFYQGCNSKI